MSGFWSGWIILLTLIVLVGATWLLFGNRYRAGDQETTGHEFDGIEEYDNPLPAWWLWGFVITIVFGVLYVMIYPGLGSFKGALGWSGVSQYEAEQDKARKQYGPIYQKYASMSIADVAKDPEAMRMARRLFSDNCSQCHGSDARGGRGYPNLRDGVWQWGGEPEQILATISNGRQAAMPAWQAVIGDQGIAEVTEYVLSLSGVSHDEATAAAGAKRFATFCAACHGADAKGNAALGAPSLADNVWLYGGSRTAIRETLRQGRNGVMPAQKDRLYPEKVHLLAAYVYGLKD